MSQYSIFQPTEIPLYRQLRPDEWSAYSDFSDITQIKEEFARKPFSLLLYGPPGCGKTTTIELLAKSSSMPFVSLSSTETTLEEIRKIIKAHSGGVLLFMDEIHRFAKSRQDIFLKPVEEGQVVLLAATTESPWYYLTRPLLSRMRIKEIVPASLQKYQEIIENIWLRRFAVFEPQELWHQIIEQTWPDFRKTFQTLEHASALVATVVSQQKQQTSKLTQSLEEPLPPPQQEQNAGSSAPYCLQEKDKQALIAKVEDFLQQNHQLSADFSTLQYDNLSAFIKSMRGSDADATLLYLANLLNAGVEPALVARRLVVFASEDVGLADNQALLIAHAALQSVEKIGMPEARILLGHAAVYLATAAKSNSAYKGINEALTFVKDKDIRPPAHILNRSPQRKNYKYPHQFGGYVEQSYWPLQVPRQNFYRPIHGKFANSEENDRADYCWQAKKGK